MLGHPPTARRMLTRHDDLHGRCFGSAQGSHPSDSFSGRSDSKTMGTSLATRHVAHPEWPPAAKSKGSMSRDPFNDRSDSKVCQAQQSASGQGCVMAVKALISDSAEPRRGRPRSPGMGHRVRAAAIDRAHRWGAGVVQYHQGRAPCGRGQRLGLVTLARSPRSCARGAVVPAGLGGRPGNRRSGSEASAPVRAAGPGAQRAALRSHP